MLAGQGDFPEKVNTEIVAIQRVETAAGQAQLRNLIQVRQSVSQSLSVCQSVGQCWHALGGALLATCACRGPRRCPSCNYLPVGSHLLLGFGVFICDNRFCFLVKSAVSSHSHVQVTWPIHRGCRTM